MAGDDIRQPDQNKRLSLEIKDTQYAVIFDDSLPPWGWRLDKRILSLGAKAMDSAE